MGIIVLIFFLMAFPFTREFYRATEGTVSGWFHHVAVVKDGIVYDGMTGSSVIALDKYKSMFEYSDMINFTPVKNLTLK